MEGQEGEKPYEEDRYCGGLAVAFRGLQQRPELQEVLAHADQHYDHNMSDVFF